MPPKKARRADIEDEQASARPFWSGTLTFGLVSVPVNLLPANQTSRPALRLLGPDGQPLARKYYSQKTERDLDADQMVRGYETSKDKFVVVADEELERLAPEKTRDIDLKLFVDRKSIPPIYFERSYFLVPDASSEKAYRLLTETMEKSDLAGIATFVMRGKEYLVAIFPDDGLLRAETMRFSDEVRAPDEIGVPKKKNVPKAAVSKFEKLISKHSKKQLSRTILSDRQSDRLRKLVEKKRKNRKNIVKVETPDKDEGKVIDLVEVLKKSLAGKKR